MGHVGLPDPVGRVSLEAAPGAARALVWLGRDEPRGMQDPPDRRARGGPEPVALEVPGDRQRAGVEPLCAELGAQGHDVLAHRIGCPAWGGLRST